jgi:hypothetical protein
MAESLRPITVDASQFRWRFDGALVVVPMGRSGPQLRVDWGWQDWLEPDGPGPEPSIVTPRFVAEAIRFALDHGWQPNVSGPPMVLGFERSSFSVAKSIA